MILNGTVAVSGITTCTAANPTNMTANTTNSATTRASFHGYLAPPHCSASSSATMEGRKNRVPSGSRRRTWVFQGAGVGFLRGTWRKKMRQRRATPPMGRLIQKHQRQERALVKAPPRRGPMTEEKPKTMPNMAGGC